jgi:hypothetical protein
VPLLDRVLLRRLIVMFGLALLIPAVSGCVHNPVAYTGPKRSPDEVSIVKGSWSNWGGAYQTVRITRIDGLEQIESWKGPAPDVHLDAGLHEIGVRYYYKSQGLGLVYLVANVTQDIKSRGMERTLLLDLEPGRTYAVHFIKEPLQYFVSRYSSDRAPDPLPWDPPWEAIECQAIANEDKRLRCDFPPVSNP